MRGMYISVSKRAPSAVPPMQPVTIFSPLNSTQIELRASSTAAPGQQITAYIFERSDALVGPWQVIYDGPLSTVTDGGRTPGQTYYYRAYVRQTDLQVSATSYAAGVATPGTTAGGAPTVVLTALGPSEILVDISAIPVSGQTIVAFEVQRSLDGVSGWTTVPTPDYIVNSEIPPLDTRPANKWVSPTGNYLGNPAFTTLAAMVATLAPGDIVDIGPGAYAPTVVNRGGTVGNPVYLRAADPLDRPYIDGNYTLPLGWNESGNVPGSAALFTVAASYVTVDGLDTRNSRVNGIICGPANNNGSYIENPNEWFFGITLIRCSAIGCNSAGWKTLNVSGSRAIGCTFRDLERGAYRADGFLNLNPNGWGAGVMAMGIDIDMIETTVAQVSGEGIHAGYHGKFDATPPPGTNGLIHMQATNLNIRNCRVFDCWSACIYVTNVDGGSIERTAVYHTSDPRYMYGATGGFAQYGIDFGSESGNTGIGGTNGLFGTRNFVVKNCIVTGCVYPLRFANWPNQFFSNIKILYNTIYTTVPGGAASIASLVSNSQGNLASVTWAGNICYEPVSTQMCRTWNPVSGFIKGVNIYSWLPPSALSGVGDIVTGSPGLANPTYLPTEHYPSVSSFDATQLQIVIGGTAVNTGDPYPEVTTDFFGRTRPTGSGKLDIGAHSLSKLNDAEYTDSGASAGVTNFYRVRYTQSGGVTSAYGSASLAL